MAFEVGGGSAEEGGVVVEEAESHVALAADGVTEEAGLVAVVLHQLGVGLAEGAGAAGAEAGAFAVPLLSPGVDWLHGSSMWSGQYILAAGIVREAGSAAASVEFGLCSRAPSGSPTGV